MGKRKKKHKPTKGAFGFKSKAQRRAEELALREEFEADRKAALEKIKLVDKERKKSGDNIQTD